MRRVKLMIIFEALVTYLVIVELNITKATIYCQASGSVG